MLKAKGRSSPSTGGRRRRSGRSGAACGEHCEVGLLLLGVRNDAALVLLLEELLMLQLL